MRYMLLILEPRGQREARTPEQGQAAYDAMLGYAEQLKTEGRLRGVESLLRDDQAVRLQVRQGEARTLDGPFTEAKEMVGGFFLVECAGRDEALALAARCPAAAWATVEVRPAGPCFA